eukprot:gene7779-10568_t
MDVWIISFFVCLFILEVIKSDSTTVTSSLQESCHEDLQSFCPELRGIWEIYCLYEFKAELTEKCQLYLGSTTVGGCNQEAEILCPEYTDVSSIMHCLNSNKVKLGATCAANILKAESESSNNPIKSAETKLKRITRSVTIMSLVYLCIPLLFALWATIMMTLLHFEQASILKEKRKLSIDGTAVSFNKTDSCRVVERDTDVTSEKAWNISFYDLSFWIYKKIDWNRPLVQMKRPILQRITGLLPSSCVTAIMGPSGSGKSTLLNLIGGQTYVGEFLGKRAINGDIKSHYRYDQIMRRQGFVTQQDNLFSTLTVWQTIFYSALLRMPESISRKDKLIRAAKVMEDLGLSGIAHSVVGSSVSENRNVEKGISGGQRRRLSIALELLGSPAVLLLDEPTSGLDATTSLKIVKALHVMSRKYSMTIALTIHQPRAEVFSLFERLVLLGTGGYLIYSGLTTSAAPLFFTIKS